MHTVLQVRDSEGDLKLYSIGEPNSDKAEHLGYKNKDEIGQKKLIHELSVFNGRKIECFAAGWNATLVILSGPKSSISEDLYKHKEDQYGLYHFKTDNDGAPSELT
jgi:hypothetical protein